MLALICGGAIAQDRAALLGGVSEVVTGGGIPGDFVVFGERAFVVLTGAEGSARLPMIAAAHYGKGRAVAAGHEAFFNAETLKNPDNTRLTENIAHWTGGKPLKGLRVGLLRQDEGLRDTLAKAGCQATALSAAMFPAGLRGVDLLWVDQASFDGAANSSRIVAIQKWVEAGGGIVVTGPAWGWQQVTGRDLSRDHSGSQLLRPMGIAFSGNLLFPGGKRGFLADGEESPLTQANLALKAFEDQAAGRATLSAAQQEQATATLGQAIAVLPAEQSDFTRRVETLCANKGTEIPTRQTPITRAMPFARLCAVLDWQKLRRLPPEQVKAHPSAASFPGSVPADAKRETRIITVDTRVPEWHGTGLYAAPGEVVTVSVPASAVKVGLTIRIGEHTDALWQAGRWERFPEITLERPLNAAAVRVASPFGGTLFVVVPENCKLGEITVTIAGAVAAPRYVQGVTSPDEWKRTLRDAPAPWAELSGKLVALSVPSSAVRDLDDPAALMAYWNDVMERIYAFYAAPKRNRPERYCVDRQISAGYMHSGYPIMTGEDVAKTFCDLRVLRGANGLKCWGFYHEMGHNFQQPEWTWQSFGEVTNNLFSLYGTETLNGVKIGAHPAMTEAEMQKRMQTVAGSPGAERYYERDPWYPLTMFFTLRRAFGWEPFTKLFAEFHALPDAEKPKTEAAKRDQFLTRFSALTGHNLTKYLAAWGVETSKESQAAVAKLPAWMPPDWQAK